MIKRYHPIAKGDIIFKELLSQVVNYYVHLGHNNILQNKVHLEVLIIFKPTTHSSQKEYRMTIANLSMFTENMIRRCI